LKTAVRAGARCACIDFFDREIGAEGYGFNSNASMKFRVNGAISKWRVNPWCFDAAKIRENALGLNSKAAFD
jgi:hypothetical protein